MNLSKISNRSDLLTEERILLMDSATKEGVLNALVDVLAQSPQVTDVEDLREGIFHREKLMSTGIGLGLGIPHVRRASVTDIVLAVAILKSPIKEYEAFDGLPVRAVFMIAAGKNQHTEHIRLLAEISATVKKPGFFDQLTMASDRHTVYTLLTQQNG